MEILASQPDPPRSYNLPDMQLQMALLDRLVERWPEATIVPSLAERWEISEDGLRYVFHLKEGLQWSDGTPLTASDVEYGIKRSLDPERPGVSVSIYYVLEGGQDYALGRSADSASVGVHALDDRTVEFRLAAPAPYFLSVVNRPDGGPQPRHAVERQGDDWIEPADQVVSGAFRQVERTAERVVLERRADAPPRPGNVARVEITLTDVPEALNAYDAGDLDLVIVNPFSTHLASLASRPDDADLGPAAWTLYLLIQHELPPYGNLDLRRALAHAIDREALATRDLPPGVAVATGGVVPPTLQGHTPDIAPRFDPELAREHLARAGIDRPIEVVTTAGGVVEQLCCDVVEGWRETLGIDVRLELLDQQEFVRVRMRLHESGPIVPTGWFPGYPDPEYYLRLLLHSEAADNRGRWSHPPYDELIERARREPDGPTRLELFHAADRLAIADQIAVIPLAYARSVFYVKPHVHGWWEFGKSWPSFADLVVEEQPE